MAGLHALAELMGAAGINSIESLRGNRDRLRGYMLDEGLLNVLQNTAFSWGTTISGIEPGSCKSDGINYVPRCSIRAASSFSRMQRSIGCKKNSVRGFSAYPLASSTNPAIRSRDTGSLPHCVSDQRDRSLLTAHQIFLPHGSRYQLPSRAARTSCFQKGSKSSIVQYEKFAEIA